MSRVYENLWQCQHKLIIIGKYTLYMEWIHNIVWSNSENDPKVKYLQTDK